MRALLLIGAMFGAGYASVWWLAIEHMTHRSSPWNLVAMPLVLGTIALVALFAWTMLDAFIGGTD